jgi:apolipoprotein N-acyltransferase
MGELSVFKRGLYIFWKRECMRVIRIISTSIMIVIAGVIGIILVLFLFVALLVSPVGLFKLLQLASHMPSNYYSLTVIGISLWAALSSWLFVSFIRHISRLGAEDFNGNESSNECS